MNLSLDYDDYCHVIEGFVAVCLLGEGGGVYLNPHTPDYTIR